MSRITRPLSRKICQLFNGKVALCTLSKEAQCVGAEAGNCCGQSLNPPPDSSPSAALLGTAAIYRFPTSTDGILISTHASLSVKCDDSKKESGLGVPDAICRTSRRRVTLQAIDFIPIYSAHLKRWPRSRTSAAV